MIYFIGWSLFLIFFRLYLSMKVAGRENVPPKGPFIFAANHTSYLDPILIGTSVYRSLNYMARANLFKRPCFGWIMRGVHAFPVQRSKGDLGAIRQALEILDSGRPLVMFPEGTRAKDKNLRPAKPGIGFIVSRSGAPVVPAYVWGSFDALPRGIRTLKRHPVKVYIGKPMNFNMTEYGKKDRQAYQKISDEIMRRIRELKDQAERQGY